METIVTGHLIKIIGTQLWWQQPVFITFLFLGSYWDCCERCLSFSPSSPFPNASTSSSCIMWREDPLWAPWGHLCTVVLRPQGERLSQFNSHRLFLVKQNHFSCKNCYCRVHNDTWILSGCSYPLERGQFSNGMRTVLLLIKIYSGDQDAQPLIGSADSPS